MAAAQRVDDRLAASVRERLVICVCADGSDQRARVLSDALKRIALIKLQMSPKHEIAIAVSAQAAGPFRVAQEFTRDPSAVARALDEVTRPEDGPSLDSLPLDALLGATARFFRQCDADGSAGPQVSYRLLLVIQQKRQVPRIDASRAALSDPFLDDPRFTLDVVYWHLEDSVEQAQDVFDQLCAFDSNDRLGNFYFTEVGDAPERLHQVLALMLSNPAHRASQEAAEQLLWSAFSPGQSVESGAR